MNERMRRVIIVPFLAVLFLVTAGLLVHNAYRVVSQNPEVGRLLGTGVRVRTAPVVSRQHPDVFGATGEAQPSRLLPLRKPRGISADLAQKIDRVLVEVGDYVTEDQLLVQFETAALDSRLAAEEGSAAAARTNLEEVETRNQFRREEMKAAVRTARANVRSARSVLNRNEANLDRYRRLYEEDLVSRFQFEQAQADRDTAEFNLRQAEEELLRRQNELQDLEAQIESSRQETLARARLEESELKAAESDRESVVLTAPFPGIVTERMVTEDEIILPGENLMKLGQIDPIHVQARVPQEKVDRVFAGQQAEVVFDALPYQTFQADVVHVDPTIDRGSATFKVNLSLPNTGNRIRPGMSGYVRFRNQRVALVIPQPGITGSGSDTAVFVVAEGDRARLQHVQVGEVVDVGYVEILDGLKEGQEVIIHGLKDLQDGDPVRILRD